MKRRVSWQSGEGIGLENYYVPPVEMGLLTTHFMRRNAAVHGIIPILSVSVQIKSLRNQAYADQESIESAEAGRPLSPQGSVAGSRK